MTEYTKEIAPVQTSVANPVVQQPTGNLVADVANLATTAIGLFEQDANKKRQARTASLVNELSNLEVNLAQQGVSKVDRSLELDRRIRAMASNSEDELYLRSQFGARRGSLVRNDITQGIDRAEVARQQEIDASFQNALNMAPDLQGLVKRGPDGLVTEEEKLRIIDDAQVRFNQQVEAQKTLALAGEQLRGAKNEALQGVSNLDIGIGKQIDSIGGSFLGNYVTAVDSMTISSPENMQLLQEVSSQAINSVGIMRAQVESSFNQAIASSTDQDVIKDLEKRRDARIAQLDRIESTLGAETLDKAKERAAMLKTMQTELGIQGFKNFEFLGVLESVSPQASRLVLESIVNNQPDILTQVTDQTAQGIRAYLSGGDINVETLNQFSQYMEENNPDKVSSAALRVHYDFTKKVINGPSLNREMSSGELEKISGGLIGILHEAAVTDDPNQIRNATELLNSPNFSVFMSQLPEDRKAALGRFTAEFNEDVLIDTTDGLFRRLGQRTNDADIVFNADTGKFEVQGVKAASGMMDFNAAKKAMIQKEANRANAALDKIREMAVYDPQMQDARGYVDMLISQYLPQSIPVQGTLKPYELPERTASEGTVQTEQTRLDNEVVLRQLQEEVLELRKKLLEK